MLKDMTVIDRLLTVNFYILGSRLGSGLGNIKPPKSRINLTDVKVLTIMQLHNVK